MLSGKYSIVFEYFRRLTVISANIVNNVSRYNSKSRMHVQIFFTRGVYTHALYTRVLLYDGSRYVSVVRTLHDLPKRIDFRRKSVKYSNLGRLTNIFY